MAATPQIAAPIVLAVLGALIGLPRMMPTAPTGGAAVHAPVAAAATGAQPTAVASPSPSVVPSAAPAGVPVSVDGAGAQAKVSPAAPSMPAADTTTVERKLRMASDDEIAQAEAELKAAEQELQGKLTRSLPGGVKLASPEVGMELKRLREDVEAKRQRLDQMRKE